MENNVIKDFTTKIEETCGLIGYPPLGNFHLECGDSNSIMKQMKNESFDIICTILSEFVVKLAPHKRKKVLQFYADYENSFREMVRLLRVDGRMVLTVGNRKVDGIEFKTNINNHVNAIDLNMFVHNPSVIATDTTVLKTMQIFSPLLNYIFDVLLIE